MPWWRATEPRWRDMGSCSTTAPPLTSIGCSRCIPGSPRIDCGGGIAVAADRDCPCGNGSDHDRDRGPRRGRAVGRAATNAGRRPARAPAARPPRRSRPGWPTATAAAGSARSSRPAGWRSRPAGSAPPAGGACTRCTAWVIAAGGSRRLRTAARSRSVTSPRRSGSASSLAAPTASWTAMLMPTPPTGDIACAASPMHSRPSVCQRLSLFSLHVEILHVVQRRQAPDVGLRNQLGDFGFERIESARPQLRRRCPSGSGRRSGSSPRAES